MLNRLLLPLLALGARAQTVADYGDCDIPIVGATRMVFDVLSNGGQMVGYRVDPASGPSARVIVGFPGGAELAESYSELAHAFAAEGLSFISMAYPGTYNHYFASGALPTASSFPELAALYFAPLVRRLKADGASTVIGFGMALGNRYVRLAESHASLFDAVIVASAGDLFDGLTGQMAVLGAIEANVSLPTEQRYDAWRQLFLGSATRDTVIEGGFERVSKKCTSAMIPLFPVFGINPFDREEWTTILGARLLVIAGSEDNYAPVATNGEVYKSFSPDTVTLVVIEGGGHMLNFGAPATVARESRLYLERTIDDAVCASWCNAWTCGLNACRDCDVTMKSECGPEQHYCLPFCNAYTCSLEHCQGCATCKSVTAGTHCSPWCNSFTCFSELCTGCTECAAVAAGTQCSGWCNSYTCGAADSFFGKQCGGCSLCA